MRQPSDMLRRRHSAGTASGCAQVLMSAPYRPVPNSSGTKVFIGAQKSADGTLTAARVNAGKDGLTPPM